MDKRKTTWVVLGLGVLGLITAGVLFGPRLYERFFATVTPLGTVTKLEQVSPAASGEKNSLAAPTGRRVWAVHFKPKPSTGEAEGKTQVFSDTSIDLTSPRFGANLTGKSDPMRETYIVDETGEKHAALQAQGKLMTQDEPGPPGTVSLHFRLERLIFALPQERRPRLLQVSDAPAVRLPGAS
jgi:hypothetical protein